MIEIVPLSPHVGAEIRGVDLTRETTPGLRDELYAAWLKHLVLVFRGQNLTAEDQGRFTILFGEIQPPRSRPGQRDPSNPVMWIAMRRRLTASGENCPRATCSSMPTSAITKIPQKARFSAALKFHQRAAIRCLPAPMPLTTAWRQPCANAPSESRFCFSMIIRRMPTAKRQQIGPMRRYIHPAVIVHPETGRRCLLVNRLMADSIVGMPRTQSDQMIEELCRATERSEHIYEHVWKPADLLIWDNRCTLHARTDFDPAERRVLRRMAIRGERPIAAVAAR